MAQCGLQLLDDQPGAGFDLPLVGIARFLHVALRNTVGAEEHVGAVRVRAGLDLARDQPGHGVDIAPVIVIAADASNRQSCEDRISLTKTLKLPKAGTAGANREVRVKRQHHHLIHIVGFDVCHRRFGEWVPVAHRHVAGGLDPKQAQGTLQLPRLLLGDSPQWRATADRAISLLRLARPQTAYQPSQRFLQGRVG